MNKKYLVIFCLIAGAAYLYFFHFNKPISRPVTPYQQHQIEEEYKPEWIEHEKQELEKPSEIRDLLDAHNAERKRQGKLEMADDLCEAAQKHADWMAEHHNMTHRGFKNRIPSGYSGAGENIAMGQENVEEVMDAWMHSSGHRANILNKSFTHAGFGVAEGRNGTKFWCSMFGSKQWTLTDSLMNHPIMNYFKELWRHILGPSEDNTASKK